MYNIILKWQAFEVSLFDNDEFIVENIENLTWANSELALTTNPYMAGDNIANSRPMARDIGITIKPTSDKGDYSKLVHKLGMLFNKEVTLVWKDRVIPSNTILEGKEMEPLITDVQLSGIVNEFEAPRFDDSVRIQMNIHCPNPFWEAVDELEYGVPDVGSIVICPYTEVDCGLTIKFLNISGGLQNNGYFDMDFTYDTPDESIPPTTIRIKKKYNESGGVIAISNLHATFEKGNVDIYQIYNGNKVSLNDTFTFSFRRGVWSGRHWDMEEVNEFPKMPSSLYPFFVRTRFSSNGDTRIDVGGGLVWKPLFL